ncbi:MAG: hypothetical protein PUB61_03340 [Bacteroidales bacterium]|nr:hypothetical protein [Bacteroidales bacterium]MDD6621127.1 hypothetical protein [Bacteroidales bacterium]
MKTKTTFAGGTTKAVKARCTGRVVLLFAAVFMLLSPAKMYASGDITTSMIELRDHLALLSYISVKVPIYDDNGLFDVTKSEFVK